MRRILLLVSLAISSPILLLFSDAIDIPTPISGGGNSNANSAVPNQVVKAFMEHSTLAGVIRRSAKLITITPEKAKIISEGLSHVVHPEELFFFLALGWFTLPALSMQYDALGMAGRGRRAKPFEDTAVHLVFDNLGQLSKLAFVIYMVDIVKVVVQGMGFQFTTVGGGGNDNIPHAFAKICYTGWVANRLAALKRYALARHTRQDYRDLEGQVQIVDRLIDAAIYGLALYVAVDTVQADMGTATKSVVAFGSVGTLVVSLAMQGFVAELLHGLFLAGSNRINEGDNVEVLGMSGKIEKLGWLESTLRKSDNILVSIPNKDLAGQKIANLSRVRYSQIKQTLRFKYDNDAFEKLPDLMDEIRDEIAKACPTLITDGSRPCRIHMTNFHGDYIEVVCNLHFRIKPVGDNYWNNRQQALVAIGRIVKHSKLEFAVMG